MDLQIRARRDGGEAASFNGTSMKMRKFVFWEGDEERGAKEEGTGKKIKRVPSSPNPLKKQQCE